MSDKTVNRRVEDRRMNDYAKDIKDILSIVKMIEIQNATRDASIKAIGEQAKANHIAIEGNGKPGIKSDVERIQGSMRIIAWFTSIVGTAMILYIINGLLP